MNKGKGIEDMKLGIMQPYFLPYIGYWQLINAVDEYVICDDVNFIRHGWINRNRMLINNEPRLFNIQMLSASPNKLINQIEMSQDNIWKEKLLKTIKYCYSKAPYYKEVYPIIQDIIMCNESNLSKYIEYSIRIICKYLNINTKIIISSSLNKNNELKGQDRPIHICKILGATEYYNAIGGQELYSYKDFQDNGIKLRFLEADKIEYKQYSSDFIPNLSILDVMMFNSVEEINIMLNQYTLKSE